MFDETQDNFKRLEEVFGMHSRQIIFWTGAGLSAPADLPTWADFLDKIVRRSEKLLNEVQYSEKELAHKQSLIKLAKVGTNFWKNFSLLHEVLEESTYAETVRSIFRSAERCPVPENYFAILDLHPTGIITTNIDRLVIRAHSESKTKHRLHGTPLVFNGTDCKDFMYALAGTRFFILNLHGVFEKRSSWCFRSEELSSLMSDQYYKQFIDTCFTSKAVVFVGATIDDVSIKAHLDRTRKDNPSDNVSLFWLTPDRSQTTRAFCEQYNVLPIYYDPSNDHSDLKDIFVRLKAYCPSDERIERPVVPPKSTSEKSVRNFDEINLSGLTLNELRKVLNRKAQSIISSDNDDAYRRYLEFRQKYSMYVHNSWHVDPPYNQLFEFELSKEIDEGAFGRVFEARDPAGNIVAVKLLKEDVMRKDDWLQAFRRGVKAMQILNEHNILGMVKYISASEIPTFVAMEYVDGINLKNAIETQQLKEWRDILRLLCEVSGIIAKAHGLPEKVLHRDIRPPNIMLRGFDYNSDDWSVCVLDFDLAFHKGANEVSIQQSSDTNGFLAPEQIERESKYTTRSALVDSYGMAMLIYYVVSRKSPKPEQSLHADWHKTLLSDIAAKRCEDWESLPFRIARLIERCTRLNQGQRLDMTQIHGHLCSLRNAYLNYRSVNDGELLAEELATRIANKLGIIDLLRWDSDRFESHVQRHSGEKLTVRSDGEIIHVIVSWHNDGKAKFEHVRNTICEAATAVKAKFSKHGFVDLNVSIEATGAMIDLDLTNSQVCLQMNLLADLIASIKLAPKVY